MFREHLEKGNMQLSKSKGLEFKIWSYIGGASTLVSCIVCCEDVRRHEWIIASPKVIITLGASVLHLNPW